MTAIITTNPCRTFAVEPICEDVFDEVDQLISDFEPEALVGTEPFALDMWQQGNELMMWVEVPGARRENIDVSLQGDCLTITADTREREWPESATSYICERCYGKMSRTVRLPFPVDAGKISTCLENGILEIRLPKAEEAKAKHIQIKARASKS